MASIANVLFAAPGAASSAPNSNGTAASADAAGETPELEGLDFAQVLQAMLAGAGITAAPTPVDTSATAQQGGAGGIDAATRGLPQAGFFGAAQAAAASTTDHASSLTPGIQNGTTNLTPLAPATPIQAGTAASELAAAAASETALLDANGITANAGINPNESANVPTAADAMQSLEALTVREVAPDVEPPEVEADAVEASIFSEAMTEAESREPIAEESIDLHASAESADREEEIEVGDSPGEAEPMHGTHAHDAAHEVHAGSEKTKAEAASVAEQVRERIVDHAEKAREHGRVELSFDLNPPEMGRMRLNLAAQDRSLNVRLIAESPQAKQLLESQMDALKQKLAEGGISLGSFNVGRDSSGGTRLPYTPPESFAQSLGSAPETGAVRASVRFRWASGSGAVDVMA